MTKMNRRPQVFHILWSFFLTFLIARGLVYLTDIRNTLPDFYFSLFGYHLHHFNLGILALIFAGYAAITNLHVPKKYLAILFGFGLGLIVDEFGLLISLRDDYWLRQTYDVVVILLAILINIEYFSDFWRKIIKNIAGQSKKKEVLEIKNYPKVSVIIPAYNEEAFLPQTLESLKNQDYCGKYEIVVVDNASTDKTAQIAKKYGAKVLYQPQKGQSYAKQLGFEKATGQFIATTDADTIVPKNWLTQRATELLKDDELLAVSGWLRLEDGKLLPRLIVNLLSPAATILYRAIFGKKILLDANYMVRKNALLAVGGYKGLDSMHEDLVLANKLAKIGKVKFISTKDWTVVTSSRRFNGAIVQETIPFIVNPIAFALFGKLPYKNYKDVRGQELAQSRPNYLFTFLLIIFFMGLGLILFPKSPVYAEAKEKLHGFMNHVHYLNHHRRLPQQLHK